MVYQCGSNEQSLNIQKSMLRNLNYLWKCRAHFITLNINLAISMSMYEIVFSEISTT